MKNENDKFDYQCQQESNYVDRLFIVILFFVAFGLTLLALFLIAWGLDFFEYNRIVNGWA